MGGGCGWVIRVARSGGTWAGRKGKEATEGGGFGGVMAGGEDLQETRFGAGGRGGRGGGGYRMDDVTGGKGVGLGHCEEGMG